MMYLRHLRPENLPAKAAKMSVLNQQREIILQGLLNTLLIIYTIGLPLVIIFWPQAFRSGHVEYYFISYAALAAITAIRTLPYLLRSSIVTVILQILGVLALFSYGLSGTGPLFLIGAAVVASVLYSHRFSRYVSAISVLILIVIGILMVTGRLPTPPTETMANSGQAGPWFIAVGVFVFILLMAVRSSMTVTNGLSTALQEREALTQTLSEESLLLEQRVEERSTDLKQRLAQFEIASRIARQISGEMNLDALLTNTVQSIRDQFHFYHAGIFLMDDRGEYAVLRAATGEAGAQMLERNHRLRIGEVGIVGYVVSQGEARIAMDVTTDPTHFRNPLLPDTRSEMALPLRAGGKTIGALDVQSVLENAFSQEDAQLLQIIADQLAIAFQKTQLVEQLQHSLEELELSQRSMIQRAWRSHIRNTRQRLAYRYRNARLEMQTGSTSEHGIQAMQQGKAVLRTQQFVDRHGNSGSVLAVPIKLRNQVLGVVDIQFDSEHVSPDLVALIDGAVNRLAVSLENARLLEEIQFRAERERLVGEISSKVRAASDVDTVLRVAAQEIGQSLGVSEVAIRLRKDAE